MLRCNLGDCVRIGAKGQVQIPPDIRQALGVGPGDNLLFEVQGQEVRVRGTKAPHGFSKYRGIGNPGIADGRKGILRWTRKARGR